MHNHKPCQQGGADEGTLWKANEKESAMDEGIFLKYFKNIIISLCSRLLGSLLNFLVRGAIDLGSTQHVSFLTLLAPHLQILGNTQKKKSRNRE